MSWKKKYQLPAWRRWQSKCATTVLNCLPLAKNLYGLLLDKPWKCLLKKKWQRKTERENIGDVLNFNRVRAIRAFCAKGWTCTGLCEQAILPPDCNASFLYCKQCSVTKTKTKKKKYIQLTRSWCLVSYFTKYRPSLGISRVLPEGTVGKWVACAVRTGKLHWGGRLLQARLREKLH